MGRIVTDSEVMEFCQVSEIGTAERLVIDGVEAAIEEYTGRSFGLQTFEEEIDVPPAIEYDEILVKGQSEIRVSNFPIVSWLKLEYVTEWDRMTGEPKVRREIPRNFYHVDVRSGVVTLRHPLTSVDALQAAVAGETFPTGVGRLIATYTAGYDSTVGPCGEVPAALKLATLMVISRWLRVTDRIAWDVEKVDNDAGGSTQYLRVFLSPEEKGLLKPYRRVV